MIDRSIYCRLAVSLSINIKRHFDRFTICNGIKKERIILLPLPHKIPGIFT